MKPKVTRHMVVRGNKLLPARGFLRIHVLKRNEGGPGQREKMRQLKAAGLECEAQHSWFVGHSQIIVYGTKKQLERAERIAFGRKR